MTMTEKDFLDAVRVVHGELGVRICTALGIATSKKDETDPNATLNKSELAEELGVSTRELTRMVGRGQIPQGERRGRERIWPVSVLKEWESEQAL